MTWGLVAVAGATLVTGVSASRSAKKAAKAGEQGQERSAAAVEFAADRARDDVMDFFPSAQQDLLAGAGAAGDIISGSVGEQQRLLSGGNLAAQSTLGQTFQTQKAALLGTAAPTFASPVQQQSPPGFAQAAPDQRVEAFLPKNVAPTLTPQQQTAQQQLSQQPGFKEAMQRLAAQDPDAFAKAIQGPLSQPLQNPLAQTGTQPGLFSDVGQVKPNAARADFGKLKTNKDVVASILSGEIDFPGVDIGFMEMLSRSANFTNGSLMTLGRLSTELNTPAKVDAYVKRTIPNLPDLQGKLKSLVAGLSGIVNA